MGEKMDYRVALDDAGSTQAYMDRTTACQRPPLRQCRTVVRKPAREPDCSVGVRVLPSQEDRPLHIHLKRDTFLTSHLHACA
jgi:hypothetical protein